MASFSRSFKYSAVFLFEHEYIESDVLRTHFTVSTAEYMLSISELLKG